MFCEKLRCLASAHGGGARVIYLELRCLERFLLERFLLERCQERFQGRPERFQWGR